MKDRIIDIPKLKEEFKEWMNEGGDGYRFPHPLGFCADKEITKREWLSIVKSDEELSYLVELCNTKFEFSILKNATFGHVNEKWAKSILTQPEYGWSFDGDGAKGDVNINFAGITRPELESGKQNKKADKK